MKTDLSILSFCSPDMNITRRYRNTGDYPCYCCGKGIPLNSAYIYNVLSTGDGNTALTALQFSKLLTEYNATSIDDILPNEGGSFRGEAFGSSCFNKLRRANPNSILVKSKTGRKFLLLA